MGRKRKAVTGGTIADEDKPRAASPQKKLHLHTDNSSAVEGKHDENNVQPNSNGLPAKKKNSTSTITNMVVRRSGRLKSPVLPARRRGAKPIVEHVNLDENENQEAPHSEKVNIVNGKNLEEPQVQQVSTLGDLNERSLIEKVNYLVRAVDEFKPKVIGRPSEGPSSDFSYKSLYINSQKKVEALMEENYELVRKLEFALGQVAAYERMKDVLSGPKELILVSGVGKSPEATLSLSPQKVQKRIPSPSVAAPDVADGSKRTKKTYKKKKAK
ncbi:hypothetical protein DH2020_046216 [Rehmannia glutinosa]|uniref:Uncharacterized protein n=1 Tax=Rehmannia glutinosa TaxID=99300 RepID=A0ABR0UDQ9_REHGL